MLNGLNRFHRILVATSLGCLLLASCKARKTAPASDVLVTNGKPIESTEFPAVMMLGNGCTASWVGPRTMLTAAHCVIGSPTMSVGGYSTEKIFANRNYRNEDGTSLHDTALLVFPAEVATKLGVTKFMSLSAADARPGEDVQLVGYGCNEWLKAPSKECTGDGQKRYGSNRLDKITNNTIYVYGVPSGPGTGVDGVNAPGDSGGPLINGRNEIIGVTSRGNGTMGMWAYVHSATSIGFLRSAIKCSAPPCADEINGARVDGGGGAGGAVAVEGGGGAPEGGLTFRSYLDSRFKDAGGRTLWLNAGKACTAKRAGQIQDCTWVFENNQITVNFSDAVAWYYKAINRNTICFIAAPGASCISGNMSRYQP